MKVLALAALLWGEVAARRGCDDDTVLHLKAELESARRTIANLQAQMSGTVSAELATAAGQEPARDLKSAKSKAKNSKSSKGGKAKKASKASATPVCDAGVSAESDEVLPDSIFDPPTADEMVKVATRLSTFDFTTEGDALTVLAPAPLAGPDRAAITELFGGQSLATTRLASPGPIWGGIQRTYLARVDTLPPAKAAATDYLFGNGAKPARYAQANVAFGALAAPKFVEYKVGPLDGPAEDMTVTRLAEQLWGSRPREGNEMRALKTMVDMILNEEEFQTLTRESFAGKTHGAGLNNHEPAPPGLVGADRFTQITILFTVEGTWRGKDLNAVPLSFTINNTDVDPSMWTADDFYYNAQGPFTRDELLDLYASDGLEKVVIPESHYAALQKASFPQRRPEYPERDFATLPGPKMYMPAGPRYTVNGRTVKWMDWEFHAGYTFRAGPNFKNIMFKGERIAYEVAMSDISLIYAANDPVAGNVNFLDATFGNGEYREVMRGVDCPDYATYLTNFWWAAPGGAQTALRSTCVFEATTGGTLWRRGGSFVSGLPDNELNVRFVMPNGNYDYIVTFTFKLDGQFRVEVGSSGYIQSHFMPPDRGSSDSMAYRVSKYAGGSIHDHTYGFKVDLDVGGETNSFMRHESKFGPTLEALNAGREAGELLTEKPPYLLFDTMRYVEYATMETEEDSLMDYDPQAPNSWFFGDSTKKNKWGNTRAYHLHLDSNPSALIPPNSHTMPAFSFANQMLGVTVHKEDEQSATGFYDLNRLDDPQGDFSRYVDGESIIQQDLVAWIALTALHLPTSENMPMTNNIVHGFTLSPHNFFDENPSMDLPHYLRMHPTEAEGDMRKEDLPVVDVCTPFEFDSLTHTFAGV